MSKQVQVNDFLDYMAQKVTGIEKTTGKTVKMIEFSNDEALIKIDGQHRQECRQKATIVFYDPKSNDNGQSVAETPSMPLLKGEPK